MVVILKQTLELKLTVQTPMSVGSGLMLLGRDLAAEFKDPKISKKIERKGLIQTSVRTEKRLVIPGSSLKGAVRSIYESITHSCLCKLDRNNKSHIEEDFLECRIKISPDPQKSKLRVCPACRIFGTMGYLGLVQFSDALCDRTGFGLSTMPTLNSPQAGARDPATGAIYFEEGVEVKDRKGKKISGKRLKGRKFYPHNRHLQQQGSTPIQVARQGYTFSTKIRFTNLSELEIGALLIALGQDNKYPLLLKMGGGKAIGKGTVTVEVKNIEQTQDIRSRYNQFNLSNSILQTNENLADLINRWTQGARQEDKLVQTQQLKKLSEILKWVS